MAPRPAATVETGLPHVVLCAAHEGSAHAVVAWLDEGGGVDARCAEHDDRDTTLLMAAADGGHEAIVRMLLQRGASVNLRNSVASGGGTALMYAAVNGNTTIAQALLDAKADASLRINDGTTALMLAEHYTHAATAQLLRQHAKRLTAEEEAAVVHATAAAPTPRLGVRIDGLKGRPELNGQCGVAERFDAAKGRYEVAVEGEAEAVLLRPANLQEVLEPALHSP